MVANSTANSLWYQLWGVRTRSAEAAGATSDAAGTADSGSGSAGVMRRPLSGTGIGPSADRRPPETANKPAPERNSAGAKAWGRTLRALCSAPAWRIPYAREAHTRERRGPKRAYTHRGGPWR